VTAETREGGQRGRQEDKKLLQRELLYAAARERAAKRRHAAERPAETEATYPCRKERLLAAGERYRRFVLKPGADKDC
jgi:hypothetical protein